MFVIDSASKILFPKAAAYQLEEVLKIINSVTKRSQVDPTKIFKTVLTQKKIRELLIIVDDKKVLKRYISGSPSAYQVALSINRQAFLSHASAVFFHGLNQQIPKTIFLNYEQSRKTIKTNSLMQTAIDEAFSKPQRESSAIYSYQDYKIKLLSSKNTNNFDVIDFNNGEEQVKLTGIARTLVDISVRPAYSGGVFQVLECYKHAKDKVKVKDIIKVLKAYDFMYPYHQTIGFYLEKAGFPKKEVNKLRDFKITQNFYLDYMIPASQLEFDKSWRLHIPKGF